MLLDLNKPYQPILDEKVDPNFDTLSKLLGHFLMIGVAPESMKKDFVKLYLMGKSLLETGAVQVDETDFQKIDLFLESLNIRISEKAQISLAISEARNDYKEKMKLLRTEDNVQEK